MTDVRNLSDGQEVQVWSNSQRLALGDVIEAQYHGMAGGHWYPGKISAAHGDGTYDIAYDDGDKDSKLSAMFIRPLYRL